MIREIEKWENFYPHQHQTFDFQQMKRMKTQENQNCKGMEKRCQYREAGT